MEKDSEINKGKKERVKSIAFKAKKESSDDETLTSGSDDQEFAMDVRNFKKFFRRKGKFVRQPRKENKSFRQRDDKKGKGDRKCFRCGDPNHLIGECLKLEESLNVTFDKSPHSFKLSPLVDDDVCEEEGIANNTKVVNNNNIDDESIEVEEVVNIKESKNHPLEQVIGNLIQRTLRSQAQNQRDKSWVVVMQEELYQFIANDVWDLVPLPKNQSIIGTKWVYMNILDKNGIVSSVGIKSLHEVTAVKVCVTAAKLNLVLFRYYQNSKAYIILNKHTMKVEESLNVTFDESPYPTKLSPLVDDDVGEEEAVDTNIKV
nr:zf-CCHC domain-containing protein/UBN2 domain-containing protein [Tanacetum cinerariifolium]